MGWKTSYYLFLTLLVAGLFLVLSYTDQGLVKLNNLKSERERIEAANHSLMEDNRRLMDQIERIKNDDGYIEDMARKKLGLIKSNEEIYRLREEPDDNYSARGNS